MSNTDDSDCSNLSERSVNFSTIEFHEHSMTLGCNPATTHGPSLELEWEEQESSILDLDEYEIMRPPRRVKNQLLMPAFVREEM